MSPGPSKLPEHTNYRRGRSGSEEVGGAEPRIDLNHLETGRYCEGGSGVSGAGHRSCCRGRGASSVPTQPRRRGSSDAIAQPRKLRLGDVRVSLLEVWFMA